MRWSSYPNVEAINEVALEKGFDRNGKCAFLYDTSQLYDRLAERERLNAVNEGSPVLKLAKGSPV